jgi:PBSX family phage terminase large subunit
METTQINIYYKPHPKQEEFHNSNAKNRAFITGLGGGKTHAGAIESLQTTLAYPDSMGLIAAPTYPLLRDSTIKKVFEILPNPLILDWNKTEHYLRLKNNSEIIFRTCNDTNAIDRLRNIELGWAWIDEAALVSHYAFKVIKGRLRQKNAPRILWLTTTPKGYNWIWEKWINKPTKDYEAILGTTLDNPYLPEDYKNDLLSEYSGIFAQQEIYGQFVGFEGQVYPEFNRQTHVIDKLPEFKEIIYGHDWGYTNPAVILVIGVDNDGRYYIVDEMYEKNLDIDQILTLSQSMETKHGKGRHFADPSEPQYIKKLNDNGIFTEEVKMEIMPGISTITGLLRNAGDNKPRVFVHSRCVNSIMEFENYRYPEKKEERPVQENPLKIMDHSMDAFRYAVMGYQERAKFHIRLG